MRKSRLIISIIIILIILGFLYYKSIINDNSNKNVIPNDPNYLEDKIAATYFSTAIDSRKQLGFILFIDKNGDVDVVETEGLELGRIAYNGNTVYYQDQCNDHTYTNELNITQRGSEHTGDYVGVLKDGSFFSIFNSGQGEDSYQSNVYWYKENELFSDSLPFFIESRGHVQDDIFTIYREDDSTNNYSLTKLNLSNESKLNDVMEWRSEIEPFSNLYVEGDNLYLAGEDIDSHTIHLIELNVDSKTATSYPIVAYKNEGNHYDAIPFDTDKSSYVYENSFYYLDGKGDVYVTNLKNKNTLKSFNIDLTTTNDDTVNITWEGSNLYVFYLNKYGKSDFNTYDIHSGEKTNSIELNGIESMFNSKVNIYGYDLIILNE